MSRAPGRMKPLRFTVGAVLAGAFACGGDEPSTSVLPPDSVVVVAEISVPPTLGQHDQFVRAGLAFLSSWNVGLQIYDVGDGRAGGGPGDPRLVSRIVTSGGAVHNAWWYWSPTGEKRYVFVGEEGPGVVGRSSVGDIHVVDISDIANPVEVARYQLTGAGTHNFWVDETNEILYAAYYNGGVVALDVSGTLSGDLASREIARFQPGGPDATYVWGVMLSGGSLYAIDMITGLWQLQLAGTAFQVLGGGDNVVDRFSSDLWVANGFAYTGTTGRRFGNPGNALYVWRLAASGAPLLVDSIVTPNISIVSDVEVSPDGRMLMFSTQYGPGAGLYFYSLVADPGRPALIRYYPVVSNGESGIHTATFAEISGRLYVFAAKYPGGADPKAPSMMVLDVTPIRP